MFQGNKRYVSVLVVGIFLGIIVSAVYHTLFLGTIALKLRDCEKKYPFTSHDLDCTEVDTSIETLSSLDHTLDTASDAYVAQGKATRVSVWIRDLETKQWAAAHENETYAPASLMKVPLMIAYYKFAQIQPSILDQQLTYEPAAAQGDSSQDYLPATLLVTGQQYSVERLIEEMIENSDNNAADILASKIDPKFFDTVLIDLGIKIPRATKEYDFVTAKTYSGIFRALFTSSYLNRTYSEKALTLMSKSAFKGLAEPLPSDVVVAHKFGEREMVNPDGTVANRELHDCGIVYKSSHPYSICVFTEGKDFTQLETIIKDVSKIVYDTI